MNFLVFFLGGALRKGEIFPDQHRCSFFLLESQNLKLLAKYRKWGGDGTFDSSPLLFKQIFT
jgi:hypothetical protein